MVEESGSTQARLEKILSILGDLQQRVEKIEATLDINPGIASRPISQSGLGETAETGSSTKPDSSLEMKIGGYWLAQAGTVVLLMGVVFLTSYPLAAIPNFLRSLMGYVAVAAFWAVSQRSSRSNAELSQILLAGAFALLYVTTVRLHFLTSEPLINSRVLALCLLVAVLAVQTVISVKRMS